MLYLEYRGLYGKKVQPKDTLGVIESIIEGKAKFEKWGNLSDIQVMQLEGFEADLGNQDYAQEFKKRMQDRIDFVQSRESEKGGLDKLPSDALEALQNVIAQI